MGKTGGLPGKPSKNPLSIPVPNPSSNVLVAPRLIATPPLATTAAAGNAQISRITPLSSKTVVSAPPQPLPGAPTAAPDSNSTRMTTPPLPQSLTQPARLAAVVPPTPGKPGHLHHSPVCAQAGGRWRKVASLRSPGQHLDPKVDLCWPVHRKLATCCQRPPAGREHNCGGVVWTCPVI